MDISVVCLLEVDAQHDRHVGIGGRCGDHHLLGTTSQVLGGVVAISEQTCGLDYDIHPEISPWQRGGVALGEHPQLAAVHDDRAVRALLDLAGVGPEDRVVPEQVSKRL